MKLSIVTTLYKSESFLERFITEIINSILELNINDYEIIFVNDGSPDNSVSYLLNKKKEIPQIKIVDLSRNFGHHYAIQAGLSVAKGELIFLIDNDLEVSPRFIINCYQRINENETIDVVYGFQENRKGAFIENMGGQLFWKLINKFSDVKIPKNLVTERLMKKEYVENLLSLGDANLFMAGMMHWTGFNQVGIPVVKGIREGKSTYSTKKRLELMIQAVTSFSGKPLEYLFYFGIIISGISFLFIIYLIFMKIRYQEEIQIGFTSLISVSILILGVLSTFLGLIGIYLLKVFKQVQNRPNYIIKKIYE